MNSEKLRNAERLEISFETAGFELGTTAEKIQAELRKRTGSDRVHVTDLYWFKPVRRYQIDVRVDRFPGDTRAPFKTVFAIQRDDIESMLNFATGWLNGLVLNPRA